MNIMPNITGIVRLGKTVLAANRPEILFGTSITATLASVALAAKGGYEARGVVMEAQFPHLDLDVDASNDIDLKEKARLTWKCYLPAAGATIGALGSTTGLHVVHINDKKKMATAALAAVQEVQASAQAYTEDLKDTVEENFKMTDAKRKAIDEGVLEKTADRNGGSAFVQNTDGLMEELYIVRDGRSGRDIWSNQARVEDAINRVNNALAMGEDTELNEFYTLSGYSALYPEGDDWGWSGELVELEWKTDVRDDGRPVKRFDFRNAPAKGYDKAHR